MAEADRKDCGGEDPFDTGNVVELPNLTSGPLGELFEAATAPGRPSELAGETDIRVLYRWEASEWPQRTRRRWRIRIPPRVAVVTVAAGILATSSSLAAATALPSPVARAVDHVGGRFGPPFLEMGAGPSHSRQKSSGTPHGTTASPGSTGSTAGGHPRTTCSSAQTSGSRNCGAATPTSTSPPSSVSRTTIANAVSPADRSQNASASNDRSGSGSGGSGTGSNRGGNQGTGSNRGGNQGTGSGHHHGGGGSTTTTTTSTSTTTSTTSTTTTAPPTDSSG
jgi:hypothetical protein